MWPQNAAAGEAFANPSELQLAHCVAFRVTEKTEHPGNRNHRYPRFGRKTDEHIAGEKRPLQAHGTVTPSRTLAVQWQIMLDGTHVQMLSNPLFVVADDVENLPTTPGLLAFIVHRWP